MVTYYDKGERLGFGGHYYLTSLNFKLHYALLTPCSPAVVGAHRRGESAGILYSGKNTFTQNKFSSVDLQWHPWVKCLLLWIVQLVEDDLISRG